MDNVLYTVSDKMIKMNSLDTLEDINKVDLPYTEVYPIYTTMGESVATAVTIKSV